MIEQADGKIKIEGYKKETEKKNLKNKKKEKE